MAGFKNSTLVAKNGDFTQADGPNANSSESNGLVTNGRLWIGSTALNVGGTHINVGTLVSTDSSITIGYSSPNITIQTTGGQPSTKFDVQANTAPGTDPVVPTALGVITVNGAAVANHSVVLETRSRAANAYNLEVQYATSAAATDATKSGVAHFNSSEFTVDANGFVSIISGGMPWTDVTASTQALSVQNGYITDRGAGVTYTLPATASLGDEIKIDGKLGLTTIAQNANQAIRMSSALSTTGVSGSVAGTNVGDCITLRCTTAGASTIWIAENFVGNWTVT